MKMRYVILTAFLAWCLPQLVCAQTTIKANVDQTHVTTDDTISYTLTITSSDKSIPQPRIPSFDHFSVISQEQSNSISFGRGGMKTSLVYLYYLVPLETGTFTIEPAQIKIKSQVYKSGEFTIEVKPGALQQKQAPQEEAPQESAEPQITL